MLNLKIVYTVNFLLVVQYVALSYQAGETCTFNGHSGSCTSIRQCLHIIKNLRPGQSPKYCSPGVVCCPSAPTARPTTTEAPASTPDPFTTGSKAFEKCKEYSKYVNEVAVTYVGNRRVEQSVSKCGHKSMALIVGGEDAKEMEFPHMALLGYDYGDSVFQWDCAGTLISDEYVLTAAHCIIVEKGKLVRVRVGDLNIETENDPAEPQDLGIAQTIVHPGYGKKYNDIALVRVQGRFRLNPYVIPACIRWDPDIVEEKAIASGWGATGFNRKKKSHLQKVTLELFDQNECNNAYVPFRARKRLPQGILPDIQFCAGHHTEFKDTCQGDSGGPLQVYQGDNIYCMYSVIGITSFSVGCAEKGFPGVYTRVSNYVQWIEDIVWP